MLAQKGRIPDPCPIKIRIDDKYVYLDVGPRDFQWDRATGKFVGAGISFAGCTIPVNLSQPVPVNLPFVMELTGIPPDAMFLSMDYEFVNEKGDPLPDAQLETDEGGKVHAPPPSDDPKFPLNLTTKLDGKPCVCGGTDAEAGKRMFPDLTLPIVPNTPDCLEKL